jgi:putative ABC transport system permease protein
MPRGLVFHVLFDRFVRVIAWKNLRADRFGTLAALFGVALGVATVNLILILDASTSLEEAAEWTMNPELPMGSDTVSVEPVKRSGAPIAPEDAREETHEDYEVMRSAVRLGSLSAFLVGGLIVFFTFAAAVERRKREVALCRSLGATRAQVAAVLAREALLVGSAGAVLGLVLAVPFAYIAARLGITTTGRSRVGTLSIPWAELVLVALVGVGTALLGALGPAREAFRLSIGETLTPRFLSDKEGHGGRRRARGTTLIALPFMVLVYGLMRPFFREALPSLTFFVVEAGLVVAGFVATIALVPEVVRRLGSWVLRIIPEGPSAPRLLTRRRVEERGHELGYSVAGLMLVFALLFGLHIATRSLQNEIDRWAEDAVSPYAFVYPLQPGRRADRLLPRLPEGLVIARFTSRTEWPISIHAVAQDELVAVARAAGGPEAIRVAEALTPGHVLLSSLMARRFKVTVGDALILRGKGGEKTVTVAAVSDAIGYVPMVGPYRNGKTYAVLEAADADVIAPYVDSVGAALAIADPRGVVADWPTFAKTLRHHAGLVIAGGSDLERLRKAGTARDFVIFDLILALSALLAAVGMANNMILGLRARRRELALYRTLGMTSADLRRTVLLEGLFVGVTGGLFAALLGVPLGYAAIGALRVVSAFDLSYDVPLSYAALTVLGAVATALVAALYPAREATRGKTAESIHYE